MPIPQPKLGELEKDFIDRCMSDEVMNEEYPDEKQRLAICNNQLEKKGGEMMQNKNYEPRSFVCEELRVVQNADRPPIIEGYAAVFDSESEDLGGFRERIQKGAFRKAIRKSDTVALYEHDRKYILGRRSARTLTIKEDDEGLRVKIRPPKWASWIVESVERGDLRAMSFGFVAKTDVWADTKRGPLRTLVEIDKLLDVSVVTHPAYLDTTVAVRSLDAWKQDNDEIVEEEKGQGNHENQPVSKFKLYERELELKRKGALL